MAKGIKKTFKDFIREAHEVHGKGTYDYSDFIFKNYSTEGLIKCKVEGHKAFEKTPNYHINKKKGCPKCSHEQRYADTFKAKCKRLGIDYWRALKRREAGMSEEKIFNPEYVRGEKETNPITVNQVTYPNHEEAFRSLKPVASLRTIERRLEDGLTPEEAFAVVPNPGYLNGIIYLIFNKKEKKAYVGLTVMSLKDRWNSHLEHSKKQKHTNENSLSEALRNYKEEDFTYDVIDVGVCKENLEEKEKKWIKKLNTLTPNGYNLNKGGSSGGSNKKPKTIGDISFESHNEAIKYVSQDKNISLAAAAKRIQVNRIDIKKPSKPGQGICKSKAYKKWDYIKYSATNPNSRDFIAGIKLCKRWEDSSLFCKDVGEPEDASFIFARIDKSKGFTPNNCRWISKSEASKLNTQWQKRRSSY